MIEVAHASRIEDAGVASKAIQRIRDRGVRVAIDDFESGYDIMTQLQGLPVDLIKLDARVTGAGLDVARTEAVCQSVLEVSRADRADGDCAGDRDDRTGGCAARDGMQDRAGRPIRSGAEIAVDGEDGEGEDRKIGSSKSKDG